MVFFHPDYTVGFGFTPNLLHEYHVARGLLQLQFTTGEELHLALKMALF